MSFWDEPSCVPCRLLAIKSTCLLDMRPPRPSEALQAATAAVQLQPDEPMHWIAKMNALRSSGNIAAAISDAKHIAQLDPDLGRDLPEVLQKLQQSRSAKPTRQRATG
jgi:predicted Zn-dependent protease